MKSFTFSSSLFFSLKNNSFLFLWLSQFFSFTSKHLQLMLLFWIILETTNSPGNVALVAFFNTVPMVLFGLFSGTLADKFQKNAVLKVVAFSGFVVSLITFFCFFLEFKDPWIIYLASFISGSAFPFEWTSSRSWVFELIGPKHLSNSMALETLVLKLGKAVGPVIGGILIYLIGAEAGYIAVPILLAISFMFLLKTPSSHKKTLPKKDNTSKTLLDVLKTSMRDSHVLGVFLVTIIVNMFLFPYVAMVPNIGRDVLNTTPFFIGLLLGADGIGSLVGALIVASRKEIKNGARLFIYGALISSLTLVLFSFSKIYFLSLISLFILGIAVSGFSTMQSTLVILNTQKNIHGKALGILTMAMGFHPIGALIIGFFATLQGSQFAIQATSVLCVCFLVVVSPLLLKPSNKQTSGSRVR